MNNATLAILLAFLITAEADPANFGNDLETDKSRVLNSTNNVKALVKHWSDLKKLPDLVRKFDKDRAKAINTTSNDEHGPKDICEPLGVIYTTLGDSVRQEITGDCLKAMLNGTDPKAKVEEIQGKIPKDLVRENFRNILEFMLTRLSESTTSKALSNILNLKDDNLCGQVKNADIAKMFKENKKYHTVMQAECIGNLKKLGDSTDNDLKEWAVHAGKMGEEAFSQVTGPISTRIIKNMTKAQVEKYYTKADDDTAEEDRGDEFDWTACSKLGLAGVRSTIFVRRCVASTKPLTMEKPALVTNLRKDIFSAVTSGNFSKVCSSLSDDLWASFDAEQLNGFLKQAESKDSNNEVSWENCEHLPSSIFTHKIENKVFKHDNLELNAQCIANLSDVSVSAYFGVTKNPPEDALSKLDSAKASMISCKDRKDNEHKGIEAIVRCSAAAGGSGYVRLLRNLTQEAGPNHPCYLLDATHHLPDDVWDNVAEPCLESLKIEHELRLMETPEKDMKLHPRVVGHTITWEAFSKYMADKDEGKKTMDHFSVDLWAQLVSARKFCSTVPTEEWPKMPEGHFLQVSHRCVTAIKGKDKIAVDRWVKLPADRWTDLDVTTLKGLEAVVPKLDATRWGRLSANVAGAKAFGAAVTAAEVSTVGKDSKTSGGYITPAHIEQANANILNQLPNAVYRAFSADHIKALQPDAIVGLTKEQLTGAALQHCSAAQIAKIGANHAKTDKDPIVLFKDLGLSGEAKEAYRQRGAANGMAASIGLITAAAAIVAWIAL